VRHRHLRQRPGNNQRDDGGEDVREDDAGAGQANGDAGAEKEPGADGAAEGNHPQLAWRQAAGKVILARGN